MLDISGLHSDCEIIKAIRGVNIYVDKGELVSLLDANGAGKSTLLKSVTDMVHIERGSIKYQEEELVGKKSHEIIPIGIPVVPEGRKIFADVTMMENPVIGSCTGAADKALNQRILDQIFEFFPRLVEGKARMGRTLSEGRQQMLAVGRAMVSDPKLLLLDEPSMGLAPLMVEQVFHIIEKLRRTGIAILLVERSARMAIKIGDRSYMLSTGKIAGKLGTSDGTSQDALLEVYLGKSRK